MATHRYRHLAFLGFLTLLYVVAGRFGLSLATVHENVSLVWAPTGIALAAVLLFGYRVWPALLVGAFIVNAATAAPLGAAIAIAIGNTLEAVAGAWLMRRLFDFRNSFDRVQDLIALVIAAAFGPMISATIGATTLLISGQILSSDYPSTWFSWWLGDAMGALIVAPVPLALAAGRRPAISVWRVAEALALIACLVIAAGFVFSGQSSTSLTYSPLAFCVFPFLIWAAIRFGQPGATTATLLVVGIVIYGRVHALSSLRVSMTEEGLIYVHAFMAAASVTTMLLAAVLAERSNVQDKLRESQDLLQAVIDNSKALISVKNTQGRFMFVNKRFEGLFHVSKGEIVGKTDYDIFPAEIAEVFREHDRQVLEANRPLEWEELVPLEDGPHAYISIKCPLNDESGATYAVCGISTDITERKQLEGQLHQAQKMEAVGMLAGGIAHDFNNLLTAIIGYSELGLSQASKGSRQHETLMEIRKAGDRAAALTNQLLAFSRRQILQPAILDLNCIIADMEDMLRRLIGEDIELVTVLRSPLAKVKADRSKVEQVIINLAINGRDAMPNGGGLTIESADVLLDDVYGRTHAGVELGKYVMLAVSDTGHGMDRETAAQVFEPFFTTKVKGRGTGLGLSTVYGIVKQSSGYIWVYSETGYGTTFKIYLPSVEEPVESEPVRPSDAIETQGCETILVVEDEDVVRRLICDVLTRSGYIVLEASNGKKAIQICEEHQNRIHLLITDVIMPHMNGRDLADRVAQLRSDLKILYISGYTDSAIDRHGILETGTRFLQKPFPPRVLTCKVREVLDT